eukprot:COSAG06_NODE_44580_length_362_cov_0.783270_1_plen_82_part_01
MHLYVSTRKKKGRVVAIFDLSFLQIKSEQGRAKGCACANMHVCNACQARARAGARARKESRKTGCQAAAAATHHGSAGRVRV